MVKMNLMRQLEEETSADGDEQFGWDHVDDAHQAQAQSLPQADHWYKSKKLSGHQTSKINPNATLQNIRSVDAESSSMYDDGSFNNGYLRPSMSFDNSGADSSNIFHHHSSFNEPLVSTNVLSDRAKQIFSFRDFNRMQSKCFETIYKGDNNCVVSSPTGSGKTVLFELAILRLLNTGTNPSDLKILYMAPTKALCLQRENEWRSKFVTFGLSVGSLTSDTSFAETDKVKKANIIITTPEKWDLMTRKWRDYSRLFRLIRLLLVDEVHILRDNRGSILEVVVTRMKKICNPLRIIALSATVPNIQDVSGWIKLSCGSSQNAMTLVFGDDYRPVKLEKVVVGYKQTMNDFAFDTFLNPRLLDLIREHSISKPVLIFCPTRTSTISTARYFAKNYIVPNNSSMASSIIKDKELRELSKQGIAFHNAGLSLSDRLAVENDFIKGYTKILCSTSTLAVGVNLPAYLVVIKGTKGWNGVSFHEYSELDILQMMGRAGRPQFESQGKAILMTNSDKQTHYDKLVKGNERLESRLHVNLSENLVPEVYLGTIKSIEGAFEWIKLTFFYTRFKSNPTAYDEIPCYQSGTTDDRLIRYTESKLRELVDYKLIEIIDGEYHCTPFGNAMTRHYVLFDTMKRFVKATPGLSVSEALRILSRSEEFSNIRLKRTEKRLYKEIKDSHILKYKDGNKGVTTNEEKISLLIQYEIGGLEFPSNLDFLKLQQSFKQDKFFVFQHVGRLSRCLVDCSLEKGDFRSLTSCLQLLRCLNGRCWEDAPIVLRQLEGIGIAAVRRFTNQGVKTFSDVEALSQGSIEYYLNQRPGFGSKLLKDVSKLPKFSVETTMTGCRIKSKAVLVNVKINLNTKCDGFSWHGNPMMINVVSGLSTGELIDFRRAHASKLSGIKSFTFECPMSFKNSTLKTTVSSEEIAGLTESFTLDLTYVVPKNYLDKLPVFTGLKSPNSIRYTDEVDNDDDGFDDLLVEATNDGKKGPFKKFKEKQKKEKVESIEENVSQCKHTCKDKTKCRHLCCREGMAYKSNKASKAKPVKSTQDAVKNVHKLEDESGAGLRKKQLSGADLLNKLHESSGTAASASEIGLKKYRYYEPVVNLKETVAPHVDTADSTDTDNSADVISLLREARYKKRTIDIDEFELNGRDAESESDTSLLMVDPPKIDAKPRKGKSIEHLFSSSQTPEAVLQNLTREIDDNFIGNKQPEQHSPIDHDYSREPSPVVRDSAHNSQTSLSGLDDILGSDVEIV